MSDVIAKLRSEMQERLEEIEQELSHVQQLLDERERLRTAFEQPPFAPESARWRPAPRAAAAASAPGKPRAPRGANREAILTAVAERPGVTATTIADVTKISKAVTYNTLAKLVEQNLIEKTELPGGQTGYKTPSPA